MPKAKKDKKLENMTEEQRKQYLEQKMLAEEEEKRKKEELLNQFLKDKLAKEEKAAKFNLMKIQNQWRALMRQAKAKELRKEIDVLSQTFERIVDRKNAIIRSLAKDLAEAEEQFQMALRSHLEKLESLKELQQSRLASLEKEFQSDLSILKAEFDTERSALIEKHKAETSDVMDVMFAMEQEFQEKETDAKQEYQSIRDEIKNKNVEERHALRIQLEGQTEDLWKQIREQMKQYKETTAERASLFRKLKAKDEQSALEIKQQMRKLQRIQDQISGLKSKMSSNTRENDERIRALKGEKEAILTHFQELKGQMNRFREAERERLTQLTMYSDRAIKELKRKEAKAGRILKLCEMCRKLESEDEKILPFYGSSLTAKEEDEISESIAQPANEAMASTASEYGPLENFWKRYNKVLLDRVALDKEKATLLEENQQLKIVLKQYLDGISVNDEIMSRNNPLFVINQRSSIFPVSVADPRVKRPAPCVVEAAHVIKHTL